MPAKAKPADPPAVSEDAVRQRAYFMWEADGRPHGRHEHYWGLAYAEAVDEARGNGRAKPARKPAEVIGKQLKNAKPRALKAETKPTKKTATKPRAAVAK